LSAGIQHSQAQEQRYQESFHATLIPAAKVQKAAEITKRMTFYLVDAQMELAIVAP
jgi:hypothetical protein